MNLDDFTFQKNFILDDYHNLFRDLCWHCFWMSLGIDLGSILLCFGYCFHVFPRSNFRIDLFNDCYRKWIHFGSHFSKMRWPCWRPFRDLFPHTSTFYQGRSYKCQKPCFQLFSNHNTKNSTLVPFTIVRPSSVP